MLTTSGFSRISFANWLFWNNSTGITPSLLLFGFAFLRIASSSGTSLSLCFSFTLGFTRIDSTDPWNFPQAGQEILILPFASKLLYPPPSLPGPRGTLKLIRSGYKKLRSFYCFLFTALHTLKRNKKRQRLNTKLIQDSVFLSGLNRSASCIRVVLPVSTRNDSGDVSKTEERKIDPVFLPVYLHTGRWSRFGASDQCPPSDMVARFASFWDGCISSDTNWYLLSVSSFNLHSLIG